MKTTYVQPKWAISISKFWTKFCHSLQALFDLVWGVGGSVSVGSGYVASKIFSVTGNALDPVIAANLFILLASAVVVWGLYSWTWIGITFGGFLGAPALISGILGFVAGVLLNISQILPDVGQLFKEYADVLGRAGKDAEARRWDDSGITASNFLGYSLSRLKFFQNLSFITELTGSTLYQFLVGGFTKSAIVKGILVMKPLGFWPMMGSIGWCIALVRAPEYAIKAAAAAVHVAASLPARSYD